MGTEQPTPTDKAAENQTDATTPVDDDDDVDGHAWFAKFDGVDGESRNAPHEGWIDVLSWSWGASQSATVIGGLRNP